MLHIPSNKPLHTLFCISISLLVSLVFVFYIHINTKIVTVIVNVVITIACNYKTNDLFTSETRLGKVTGQDKDNQPGLISFLLKLPKTSTFV